MKESHDSLGDRMKNAENCFRYYLPRKTNVIMRLDSRAGHTSFKNCIKPFDDNLMRAFDETAIALCKDISGAKLAYCQSDELNLLLTDYDQSNTESWFDNNIQKMCSISASIATAKFNEVKPSYITKPVYFDSRVFILPNLSEVANLFLWRQRDWEKNSLQMLARSLYSHKELHNKNFTGLHDLCMAKGVNWSKLDSRYKNGRIIIKNEVFKSVKIKDREAIVLRKEWVAKSMDFQGYEDWFNLINKFIQNKNDCFANY